MSCAASSGTVRAATLIWLSSMKVRIFLMCRMGIGASASSTAARTTKGAFSSAAVVGNLVFVSGQVPQDPESGEIRSDLPFAEQVRQRDTDRTAESAGEREVILRRTQQTKREQPDAERAGEPRDDHGRRGDQL